MCRDLWVLMAELATLPENHGKLVDGQTRVTAEMVVAVEALVDDLGARFEAPSQFVVPGQTPLAAQLDLARTVVRRAEREAAAATVPGVARARPTSIASRPCCGCRPAGSRASTC